MNEPTITCPNCKTAIKHTESLATPLIEPTIEMSGDLQEIAGMTLHEIAGLDLQTRVWPSTELAPTSPSNWDSSQ
jgi:hypothetical protein